MAQQDEMGLSQWNAVTRFSVVAACIFGLYLMYHLSSDAYLLLGLVATVFLILALTLWHIRHKLSGGQWREVINDILWVVALIGVVFLSVEFWFFEPKDVFTLVVAIVAVFITYQQTAINKRIAWFTGAQETHSTTRLIMEAHDISIPVVWWDPHQEAWDPDRLKVPGYGTRGHRKIVQLPFVLLFLPEKERSLGSKDRALRAKPLTKMEINAIAKERKRLQRLNRSPRRSD